MNSGVRNMKMKTHAKAILAQFVIVSKTALGINKNKSQTNTQVHLCIHLSLLEFIYNNNNYKLTCCARGKHSTVHSVWHISKIRDF